MTRNILKAFFALCALFFAGNSFAQYVDPGQLAKDDQILTDYFAKNNIKATKTPSGVYYVITKKGTGDNVKRGQQVSMNYYGKFMDGKKFDANMDENYNSVRPAFTFTLGAGQVIKGWDEGIQYLNPGARATLYIPSGLAYGPRGGGPIAPNSILVFDVEVISAQ